MWSSRTSRISGSGVTKLRRKITNSIATKARSVLTNGDSVNSLKMWSCLFSLIGLAPPSSLDLRWQISKSMSKELSRSDKRKSRCSPQEGLQLCVQEISQAIMASTRRTNVRSSRSQWGAMRIKASTSASLSCMPSRSLSCADHLSTWPRTEPKMSNIKSSFLTAIEEILLMRVRVTLSLT